MTSFEYIQQGQEWFDAGEFNKAIESFSQAITLDQNSRVALVNRAVCWSHVGRFDKTIVDATNAISLDPNDANPFMIRAEAREHLGNYLEAVKDYSHAIKLNPLLSNAYLGLAITAFHSGNPEEALSELTQCLQLDNQNVEAYILRGKIYLHRGIYQSSINDFDQAIIFDSANTRVHSYRGSAKCGLGLYEAGMMDFDKTLSFEPKNVWVLSQRANAKQRHGDIAGCFEDLKKCVELDPNNPEAWINLARIYQQGEAKWWNCFFKAANLGHEAARTKVCEYIKELLPGRRPQVVVELLTEYGMSQLQADYLVAYIKSLVDGEKIALKQLRKGKEPRTVATLLINRGHTANQAEAIVERAYHAIHPSEEFILKKAVENMKEVELSRHGSYILLLFGILGSFISAILFSGRIMWTVIIVGLIGMIVAFFRKGILFAKLSPKLRPLPEKMDCPNCQTPLVLSDAERFEKVFLCPKCKKTINMYLASN